MHKSLDYVVQALYTVVMTEREQRHTGANEMNVRTATVEQLRERATNRFMDEGSRKAAKNELNRRGYKTATPAKFERMTDDGFAVFSNVSL